MHRLLLTILIAFCIPVFSQMPENVKFKTYPITTFKADSVKYTPWFNVADYRNIIVQARFNDPATGFKDDSCVFKYSYQLGNIALNSSGGYDTAIIGLPIVIDSVYTLDASCWAGIQHTELQTDGTFADSLHKVDTTSVTGYAVNGHAITPPPSCFARIKLEGGTDNNLSAFLSFQFDVIQFKADKTNSKEPINNGN